MVCIIHSFIIIGKDMNLTILSSALSKIVGQTVLFSLNKATSLEKGKL